MVKGIAILLLSVTMGALLYLLFFANADQRQKVVGVVEDVAQSGSDNLKSAADGAVDGARDIHGNGKDGKKGTGPPPKREPNESSAVKQLLKRVAAEGRDDFYKTDAENRIVELRLFALPVGDADMEAVGSMDHLEILLLDETKVTDRGLKRLKSLDRLRELNLANTGVTGSGLVSFGASRQTLRKLNLHSVKGIQDRHGSILAGFKALTYLNVSETNLGNKGMMALRALRKLKKIEVYNARVDLSTMDAFKRNRSNVNVLP